ncbi:MAG: hypothetical protein JSS67_00365 [Bacteroidetes bacterium]|nr:hypothetical protein [Bacteroidota bacterium]
MKRTVLPSKALLSMILMVCLGINNGFTQMKVGNNPTTINAGSMLEIEATNQGILLPRISIGNINTWGLAGVAVNGMFVYNSNAATTGGSGIGIYYWANLKWNYVQNGAATNTSWLLTGNNTTTPGTYASPGANFLGTIDAVDFAIRTFNTERMRISSAGLIGINSNYVNAQQMTVSTSVAANTAIVGQNAAAAGTNGNGIGVKGSSAQAYNATGPTNGYGVVALNSNTAGTGLYAGGNNVGLNSNFLLNGSGAALVGTNVGAFGYSTANSGIGLYGNNVGSTGFGVYGESDGAYGRGVYGYNNNIASFQRGVYGDYNQLGFGAGVTGIGDGGIIPASNSTLDIGVYGSANYGVYGNSTSTGIGVLGLNDNADGFGVYGMNTNTSGTGVLGKGNNLTGSYLTNGSGGAFTGSSTGLWAYLPTAAKGGLIGTSYTTGSYGVFGRADYYRTSSNNNDVYQFGLYGEKVMGYNNAGTTGWDKRSGGVLGTIYDTTHSTVPAWGSLGYKASGNVAGTHYGVYSTTDVIANGTDFNQNNAGGFGLGVYGGIMGGWVRGNIYGMNIKGERYGLYIDGYTYSNKPAVQLIDNGSAERTVAYTVSSLSADIYAHGKGKMVNGKAQITFDRNFQQLVDESDLSVTVTPIGESNGIHLISTDQHGFSLQENKNADNSFGTSNVEFTWIAVGKRKDITSKDIAKEVLASNYDKNMADVMFNENDLAHNAGGMEWTKDGLKFYPVTAAENASNGNHPGLMKAMEVKTSELDINNKANPAKKKAIDPSKQNSKLQQNEFIIDKISADKKNNTQAPPKGN